MCARLGTPLSRTACVNARCNTVGSIGPTAKQMAISTRVDPARDTLIVPQTPIDYLDFASPVAGIGSKMGIDATNKWPGETAREWGRRISMDADVKARVDAMWSELGLGR